MGCPKLAEGDGVRITRVDSCGRPVIGAKNAVADNCWATVSMVPNVNKGTDIKLTNMRGKSCGFKRACVEFLGFDITGTFYEASPEMIELLTGNPVYFDKFGQPIGWDDCGVPCTGGFALETWQNILGVSCNAGATGQWFYWLMPWLTNGVLGTILVDANGLTFTVTASTRNNAVWDVGPWQVQAQDTNNTPGALLTPIGTDCHRRSFLTTIAPPTYQCGYITVPPIVS